MPPAKSGAVAAGVRRRDPAGGRRMGEALVSLPANAELLIAAAGHLPAFCILGPGGEMRFASPAYQSLVAELGAAAAGALPGSQGELASEPTLGEAAQRDISVPTDPPRHLRLHYSALHGTDGGAVGLFCGIEERSELNALYHQLSLTNDRLEDVTRLVSDWIWEADADLRLTFLSPRVTEALGRQPVELIGRPLLELGRFSETVPPLEAMRQRPFRDLPFEVQHSDGKLRLFHLSSLPIFCPRSGEFLGFRGSARDITQQAEALRRAAQSKSQLTEAIESISEGFALFDPEDRLVLCNRKFTANFPGAEHAIRPGEPFETIIRAILDSGTMAISDEKRADWLAERLRLRGEPRSSFEVEFKDKRWMKVSDHRTADGSTVGIRTDITNLKHREEALFAAKEAAEIASRSKSEFLANISHELRTPLNAIIGFSEIMREEIFGPIGSPQYHEYISDVLASAQHLLEVINDILDIAKAEAGKLELSEDRVDIAAVVRAATRLVQERAQRSQVTLSTRIPDELPPILADERKLKQILLNLLTNAVKFTPAGGAVETSAGFAENDDLLVTVRDTGIGIAEEHIATALAPFGQVDSKLNRKYEGTGLGLPLCSAMVRLHGGELTIESKVGSGTTVTVRLPKVRVRAGD